MPFLSIAYVRVEIAVWVDDYSRDRSHSPLWYATPATLTPELDKQWPTSLCPTDAATQPNGSTTQIRKTITRLHAPLEQNRGLRHSDLNT